MDKKSPEFMAALLGQLPDLPQQVRAHDTHSPIVSAATGEPLKRVLSVKPGDIPGLTGNRATALIVDDPAAVAQVQLPQNADGSVDYLSAQDEMMMACNWFCALSEEDCAQVLPIFRMLREGFRRVPEAPQLVLL